MSEIEENEGGDGGGGGVFDQWRMRRGSAVVFPSNDDRNASGDDDDDDDGDDGENVGEENNGGGVYADVSNSVMEEEEEEGSIERNVRKKESIAERRAATCGFNASRINVAGFRRESPLSSPVVRSPYLTIPCGISPTALLDSPIMLPNSQLSPTTGTFPLPPQNHGSSVLSSASPAAVEGMDCSVGSPFMFQPRDGRLFWPSLSELQNQPAVSPELPVELLKESAAKNSATDSSAEAKVLTNMTPIACSAALQSCYTDNQLTTFREPMNGGDTGENLLLEGYQKETYPLTGIVKNSEDGYNWRKYGQKHVKGSEFPRSYYKCTHPSCVVKKKVERSLDGQITEIIYKGAHNHQIPHPSHLTLGSAASFNDMSETGEGNGSCIKVEGRDVLRNIQLGSKDIKVGSDGRPDGLERSSSASVLTDSSDPLSSTQGKSVGVFESAGTPEFSSTLGEDDDDGTNEGKYSPGDDADDGRSEAKRRKKGNFLMETSMVSRAMREPRVVVQIESEIDILDDGYRWRKYGQKVVKGNPNPRSYYKCTSAGCLVRKHVERASDNPKAVLTTYEGKHNHEVPASRNSKNANVDAGNLPLTVSNRHSNRELPRITSISKLEAQVQDHPLHFERKLGTDYPLPSMVGNYNGMRFGASSIYQAKYVPFENPMSFGSGSPALPDFPLSLPMSIPVSASTVQGSYGFSKQVEPIDQTQTFIGGQEFRENNARFLKPKQEQDDNVFNTRLPIEDHANASLSSSMHCQVNPNFPS